MSKQNPLRVMLSDWRAQVAKLRRDAEILVAKAELLEVKCIDLDIALDKLESAALTKESGGNG